MEKWKAESRPGIQMVLSVGCTAVGLVLAIGFYDPSRPVTVNTQAGSLLGLLLLVIGVIGLLVQGTQTIVIDPATRCITVADKTLFGSKRREIKFQEIGAIHIGYLGKTSNFVRNYYLSLRLKNGEDYSLFAPGRFYKGAANRSVVEGWKDRLQRYIAAG